MPTAIKETSEIARLLGSWELSLAARNVSPATIRIYLAAGRYFAAFLADRAMPQTLAGISAEHVREWLVSLATTPSARGTPAKPATRAIYLIAVQLFFKWCVEEGEIAVSPGARVHAPAVPDEVLTLYSAADLARLLGTCARGVDFASRRDYALLALLLDTGLRLSECAGLTLADLTLTRTDRAVAVLGKGRKPRSVAFGLVAAAALDRYRRAREKHAHAALGALWLGRSGALRAPGIYAIVKRRAGEAGLPTLHPHSLRHAFADQALVNGMEERDLATLGGWSLRNPRAMRRYGQAGATRRAAAAQSKFSPLDHLPKP